MTVVPGSRTGTMLRPVAGQGIFEQSRLRAFAAAFAAVEYDEYAGGMGHQQLVK